MPRRKEIKNTLSSDVFDLRVYDKEYYINFNPSKEFEKWAVMEVADFQDIPKGMNSFTLQGGLYAVFVYKGSSGMGVFEYIFREWLPQSDYVLDPRPHFEIFDEKSQRKDPDAEEEIWVPIRAKN